jgi:enoyl-[acyl-carrier-protein] reductase (NADH)
VTKIYTYCLFDGQQAFHGVYSSLKAVHRDAVRLCNRGGGRVIMEYGGAVEAASLTRLRNLLKGACEVQVRYGAAPHNATIIKTKLKE